MPEHDPNELVHIKHPQIKAIGGPVTRQAFDDIHAAKGWSVATEADVERLASVPSSTDLDGKGK